MKQVVGLLVAGVVGLGACSAQAAAEGTYGGLGLDLGQISSSGNVNGLSSKLGMGLNLKAGYRINKYVSAEGEMGLNFPFSSSTGLSASTSDVTANMLFYYPMADAQQTASTSSVVSTKYSGYKDSAWYALVGYGKYWTKIKNDQSGAEVLNGSKTGMKFGIGLEVGHTSDATTRFGLVTFDTGYVRVTSLEYSVVRKF